MVAVGSQTGGKQATSQLVERDLSRMPVDLDRTYLTTVEASRDVPLFEQTRAEMATEDVRSALEVVGLS